MKPWIARAHAIIHPSTYGEGMSNVLLENASSGRPIITTDNLGVKKWLMMRFLDLSIQEETSIF